MRFIFLVILLNTICLHNFTSGQSIDLPSIASTGGNLTTQSNYKLEIAVGELVIEHFSNIQGNSLCQGVLPGSVCTYLGVVSTQELTTDSWKAYPNPFSTQFFIQSENFDLSQIKVTVFDLVGKVIYSKAQESFDGLIQIDASTWYNGGYLISIRNETQEIIHQSIILKSN